MSSNIPSHSEEEKGNGVPQAGQPVDVEKHLAQQMNAVSLAVYGSIDTKRTELARRREARELSPFDFAPNFLFQLNEGGFPLKRLDLVHQTGVQAVVLTRADLETLGGFDFISASGERITIEPESVPHELILFPEDLGDEEKRL